jgi:hypothetical protein
LIAATAVIRKEGISVSSQECIVIDFNNPPTTLPSRYVVQSGDTMVKVATRFGFASWKEIYYSPDNEPFRRKRPNPDKIFPGDEMLIPGSAVATVPAAVPSGGGGGAGFLHLPLALRLNIAGALGQGKPGSDLLDLNYKHPGNVRIRLTLFWVTNCVNIDTTPEVVLSKAEELYAQHGIGFDIFPSRTRIPEHTIQAPVDLLLPEHYNAIRLEAARRFDDQKTKDKRQRLPVFFCEFKDPSNGLTISGAWPPYVFVSGVLTPDKATLAHEIVHASGIIPHDKVHLSNILAEGTGSRSEMFKFQVKQVAGAYFAR